MTGFFNRVAGGLLPSREGWSAALRWGLRGVLILSAVAFVAGSIAIRDRVRSDERFFLENWKIEIGPLPAWVTPGIQEELEAIDLGATLGDDGAPARFSLFDVGVLTRVRSAIARESWVREVPSIRLQYPTPGVPGVLELGLRLRGPVALVETGGLYYLTDAEGVRLGWPYREPPTDWFQVPVITGFSGSVAVPSPGGQWGSRDIQQGLEVARILKDRNIHRDFPHRPIRAIDLSNLHGRGTARTSEIDLRVGSQRLTWGRSPISVGARAVPVDVVVSNLRMVLSMPEVTDRYSVIHLDSPSGALTAVRG
jgi:hypothetical protein